MELQKNCKSVSLSFAFSVLSLFDKYLLTNRNLELGENEKKKQNKNNQNKELYIVGERVGEGDCKAARLHSEGLLLLSVLLYFRASSRQRTSRLRRD